MSKLLRLRDNTSMYITNEQAENIHKALETNPNVRMLRILTGQGYQYVNPLQITSITPLFGDGYKSDAQLLREQQSAARVAKQVGNGTAAGYIEG